MRSNSDGSGSTLGHNGHSIQTGSREITFVYASKSDRDLWRRIHAGRDDAAFEILHARYQPWVVSLARKWVDANLAWDVSQEVFAELWSKTPALDLCCPFESVLARLVKCKAIDLLRKRRAYQFREVSELDFNADPEPAIFQEASEFWLRVRECLTPAQYRVTVLRFRDELPILDIAQLEGVPVGTVKSRLHEVRRKLGGCRKIECFAPFPTNENVE